MIPRLKNATISGKRVLVRADFNVPFSNDGVITDDFRIRATLPTIRYLLSQNCRLILMSHLGKPEGGPNPQFSLRHVAERLSLLLEMPVRFSSTCLGEEATKAAAELRPGEILLLENLRFFPDEEKNGEEFAKALASIGDFYVNDAFGSSHRAHASIVGVPKFLPHAAGLLLEKEVEALTKLRDNPSRPLVAVLGGAKLSTKLPFVEHFLSWADSVLLGGAMANTVLKAAGVSVGRSVIEEGLAAKLKTPPIQSLKLYFPIDAVLSGDVSGKLPVRTSLVRDIRNEEMVLDIGPDTGKLYDRIIRSAATIFWNGPMGVYEVPVFAHGTEEVAKAVAESPAFSIVGGGDTIVVLQKLGLLDKVDYVSSGGGAMLEFLVGKELSGITALQAPNPKP